MANPKKLTPEMLAEIQRKALAGEQLTNVTAEKQYYYDQYKNQNTAPKPTYDNTAYEGTKPTYNNAAYDKNKPPSYNSQYSDQINDLMNQILNKPDFSYDMENDPSYQSYKEQYNREGDRAMQNSMAEAASLTGGRMNSWAMTAGQQAQDYYNQKLNDMVPQLQQAAYQMYNDKYNTMYNNVNMLQGADQAAYNRYQDEYNKWADDRNFNYNQYRDSMSDWNNDRNFGYNQYRDNVADWNNDRTFNYQQALDKYSVSYQGERDTINDERYANEWENTLNQQQLAQSNWEKQFAADQAYRSASLARSGGSGGSGRSSGSSGSSKSGSSSSKPRYSDTDIKSRINSMMKETAIIGKDAFGKEIKGPAYDNNTIIEWIVGNCTEDQADKWMEYYGLEYDEKKAWMSNKGYGSSGSGINKNTMTNMRK